jgi:hypothetical protein
MVIWAEVGDGSHIGVLILPGGGIILLSHVVHSVEFVFLAVCINHRGSITPARVTFWLHVPPLFAVAADDVWVSWGIGQPLYEEHVLFGLNQIYY